MARVPESASLAKDGGDELSADGDDTLANLAPDAVKAIGDALQAHYRALIEEPLPARLLVMLAELEAKERVTELEGTEVARLAPAST